MTKTLKFWYEFASPYSYISIMRIEKLAAKAGVDVTYQPFLLGPLFQEFGWKTSPFLIFKEKGENFFRDIERECEFYGLSPLKMPEQFPQWGLTPARVALLGMEQGWGLEFSKRLFLREFDEGLPIGSIEAVTRVMEEIGLDDVVGKLALAHGDENKAKLVAATTEAKKSKIFGAPSFQAGGELFWGNDRLERALSFA